MQILILNINLFCRFLINVTLRRIFTEASLLNKQKAFEDMTSHLIVEAYSVSSKKEKRLTSMVT